jgi:CubicO group peptidase (beta-lactamase class C family)
MKKLVVLAAAAAAMAGCCAAACVRESGTTFVKDALAPYVESGELPGAISILYNDGETETACVGYADVAAKRPITADDVYMQCSQTKGFCGVTVAKLVEEGRLDLDDPVSKYLPEFKTLWIKGAETNDTRTLVKARNVLTVRMCLNHTGGFPFETSVKRSDVRGGGWSGGAPLRQNAAVAAASPILFEPGTKTQYSNTGIDVGAAVVEVVTGMKWEEYLRKTVLDPLEMKSTWFWPTDEQLKTQVEMYDCVKGAPAKWKSENPQQQRPYNDGHVFASAGAGLWTTANDQYKFYKMLMNLGVGDNGARILKEETVKSILSVSTRPAGLGGYSLGLNAPEPAADGENAWFGHGGAWGTNCMVNWRRRQLKLWAVQLNGEPRPWNRAKDEAAEKFFSAKIDTSGVDAYTGRVN